MTIPPAHVLLASLLSWIVPIVALAVHERWSRGRYVSRRGTRYRRLTTAQMLRRLRRPARD